MKIGRNSPCPCGSGKKYKKCCFDADQKTKSSGIKEANNELIASADYATADMIDASGYVPVDSPESVQEYEAMNTYVDEYLATIDESHPFRPYLLDHGIKHGSLLLLAKENGWTDYYEKAKPLYDAWVKANPKIQQVLNG